MNNALKLAAQDAAEAIDWLLKNIRLDAPQLSGKAMGNAEKCASALRTAIQQAEAQQPATGEPVGYMNDGHLHELAMRRLPYGYIYPEAGAGASTAVYTHPAPSMPATPEPVLTVEKEPDYWASGHFYEGNKPYINPTKVWHLPIGTKLYTHPSPCEPSLIEKAISSGWFGVLPVKATIPMCKAGWGASGGELTFQEIGHIYEEMYKARPLLDDADKERR